VQWPQYSPAPRIRLGSLRRGGGGAVVPSLAEPAGGSLECYYWMSGQDDEMGIFGHPGSHTRAAVSLASTSSGAFTRFETHELIEASDLTAIAERAQGTANQPLAPDKHASCSPDYPRLDRDRH
jgi:uncharacterized protein with GYD domain